MKVKTSIQRRDMPMPDHVLALHAPGRGVQYERFTRASA